MSTQYYSASYEQARYQFRQMASDSGAELSSYAVNKKAESGLSIDVAIFGPANAEKSLVVTSGIHGVEGFFGSAVQLAWLDSIANGSIARDTRVVLIHAINPHGFCHLRRFNEDNIDLNRNFPESRNEYSGAPVGYALHNRFLNPDSLPSRLELFKLKAAWKIWRHGLAALKESIASGQYQYPDGLFFGGYGAAESSRIIVQNLQAWLGQASRIIHIDLHSGLGEYGNYKLLLNESVGTDTYHWFENTFAKGTVESMNDPGGTAYPINGVFGAWCQQHNQSLDYRFVGAEFGTYDVVRVLRALREENCVHRCEEPGSARYNAAKQELLECFCPLDSGWRQAVLESGVNIINTARAAL